MNKSQNRQYTKNTARTYNSEKRVPVKQKEDFFDYFDPAVEVRNGDVGKALRILKKKLDRSDFQKDLSKQEYYEKASVSRKRRKQQAKKRWQKTLREAEMRGEYKPYVSVGTKWQKSKRKRRKMMEHQNRMRQLQRQNAII